MEGDEDESKDGEFIDIEDEFIEALEEEFENIINTFDDIRRRIIEEAAEASDQNPIVYGFSIRIGSDGKPNVEEFGNLHGMLSGDTSAPGEREPLTDVIEGDREISVVVELPGVGKDDIDLKTTESSLEINVNTAARSYHKKLSFPAKVKPDTAKASHKNGVLEVRFERAEERKGNGVHKVKID